MQKFDEYFKQTIEAIELLHAKSMFVQAVTLTYVYMDHMAWLSVDHKKHTSTDFKSWVDNYMISKNYFGCSSNDIWEARNALVHMGTSESDKFKERNAKKIYYHRKINSSGKFNSSDTVFIDIDSLITSFMAGVLFFRQDIESETHRTSIVNDKLNKLMKNFT